MSELSNDLGYVVIETATTENQMPAKIIEKRGDGRVLAEGVLQEANMKTVMVVFMILGIYFQN